MFIFLGSEKSSVQNNIPSITLRPVIFLKPSFSLLGLNVPKLRFLSPTNITSLPITSE